MNSKYFITLFYQILFNELLTNEFIKNYYRMASKRCFAWCTLGSSVCLFIFSFIFWLIVGSFVLSELKKSNFILNEVYFFTFHFFILFLLFDFYLKYIWCCVSNHLNQSLKTFDWLIDWLIDWQKTILLLIDWTNWFLLIIEYLLFSKMGMCLERRRSWNSYVWEILDL